MACTCTHTQRERGEERREGGRIEEGVKGRREREREEKTSGMTLTSGLHTHVHIQEYTPTYVYTYIYNQKTKESTGQQSGTLYASRLVLK